MEDPNPPGEPPAAAPSDVARTGRAKTVSRRTAVGAAGVGIAGLAAGAGLFLSGRDDDSAPPARGASAANPVTVDQWVAARGDTYLIAHRGSGDVYPEHSIPAYDAAVQWGAAALEVSVRMTSDGTLICLHDDTYDRTTTITGSVRQQSAQVLRDARLNAPQLGPAWTGPSITNLLHVPLLEDVLRRYGGRLILCLEAKDDVAFDPMVALVRRYGLTSSVIAKLYATSSHFDAAHRAGFAVFGYYGTAVSNAEIDTLAARLDKAKDYLVVTPTNSNADDADVAAMKHAVGTGITTWAGPVHRRYELTRYFAAGAKGAVCASFGYQNSSTALARGDAWRSRSVVSGEMTKSPGSANYAPSYTGDADLTLALPRTPHYLTLGNLSPISGPNYRIDFQARWNAPPADVQSFVELAFGHADDRYYEHGSGTSTGLSALLRANGSLELSSHTQGRTGETRIGSSVHVAPPVLGQWFSLRLTVAGSSLTWARTDGGASVSTSGSAPLAGGYLTIGRHSYDADASLSLRNLKVS